MNILFAAGGTGGHLFPAVSVAEKIIELKKDANCFFIGTENRIESIKIPQLGYSYTSMPIKPFPGKSLKAFKWLFELRRSVSISKKLILQNKIEALVCTGAYLSYPPALAAHKLNIPVYVLESNVNLGKANKMISKFASIIFTSWEQTEKYLKESPAEIVLSGNPVRDNIYSNKTQSEAKSELGFGNDLPMILVIGGSLGAEFINNSIEKNISYFKDNNINLLWQSGGSFEANGTENKESIKKVNFIDNMGIAYKAADVIISRSGATAVAEICNLGKPSILIPLPGASNNEQLLNAKQLAESNAAVLIEQNKLENELINQLSKLISDIDIRSKMSANIKNFAKVDAKSIIAERILKDHSSN